MDKGAHFYRCDFQVHSPRDLSWRGKSHSVTEDRKAYAVKFISACREKGLDAVAITDHHDMCFFKYFRHAAANELTPGGAEVPKEEKIVVYPGIELTLNIPCQAIVILDSDFPDTFLSQVLTVLAITPSQDTDEKIAEVQRLDAISTFEQLKQKLDEHDFLRDRYIILPNVTSGGSDTLLRDGVANKYKTMPCVGGYLDGAITKSNDGDRNILNGQVSHYGNKRIALFQTSDSRSEDHSQLGVVSTWVKWTVPTAEALRQACLAQESRISQTKPQLPSVVIKSIHVSNSEFMGPLDLAINPQYTALIGSRGTGKSTILEYLRWALCDEHQDEESVDGPSPVVRQRKLVENTLTKYDATVEIKFEVNGVHHMVRRRSNSGEVLLKIAQGELEECTPQDVRTLLPIQAYSQKQLSRVGVRVNELDHFVRSGIKTELNSISSQARSVVTKIRQIYSSVRRKQNVANSIREDRLNLESLSKQAQTIRESLTGLTEDQQALIAKQPIYQSGDLLVDGWNDEAKVVSDSIDDLAGLVESFPTDIDESINQLPEIRILEKLQSTLGSKSDLLRSLLKQADSAIKSIVDTDGVFEGECKTQFDEWNSAKEKFSRRYEIAKGAASSHESQLKTLGELEEKISVIRKRVDQALKELGTLGTPEQTFTEFRNRWVKLHKARGNLYQEQCSKLTELSGGAIKATALKGGNISGIEDLLKSLVKGSGLRAQKIDDFLGSVSGSNDPIVAWGVALNELEQLSYHTPEQGQEVDSPETPNLLGFGFTNADLTKLSDKLTPESWLELVLTPMEDKTTFDYQTKEGEYIPFEHASAGQQATALLFTLLNQSGPPLIIDQPEDDLDNQIIFDIVTRIWEAKTRRQIIFSSHNANLVVNGDAELVVCCDYRIAGDYSRGYVASEGAIDISEIRDSIKTIMEGGEKAFTLRLHKYGF
jgi:chromosome segregation protein